MCTVLNKDQDVSAGELSKYLEKNRAKAWEGCIAGYIGEILMNLDDQHLADAEVWFETAIELNRDNGTMLFTGRTYALLAELFKRKGDKSKAKENLTKAIDILKECGADGWVKKYDAELATLS